MSLIENWRYSRICHLQGSTFSFAKYQAPSDDWDHDHCSGCWAKFAEFDGPEILHSGYVTKTPEAEIDEPEFITECKKMGMRALPQPQVGGYWLEWVCSRCFTDFRELLGFTVEGVRPVD
jgi:hypothetical protein